MPARQPLMMPPMAARKCEEGRLQPVALTDTVPVISLAFDTVPDTFTVAGFNVVCVPAPGPETMLCLGRFQE